MEVGRFQAVVFDFDGTLGDSMAAMMRAYRIWADEFGVSLDALHDFHGVPSRTVSEALLPAELVDQASARIEELEVADAEGVVALPGAYAALTAISDSRRAIATSCTRPLINVRLPATGLPVPKVLISRDDVERGKPSPDPFLAAAEALGADPARMLVCEDAPAGVAAARAAGMKVLAVLTNYGADALGADWHAPDLSHVVFDETPDGVRVELL